MRQEYVIENVKQIPEVRIEPVKVLNQPVREFKAIVSNDDDNLLHVVGKDYQLTQHRDVYNMVASLRNYKIESATLYRSGRVLCIEVIPNDVDTIEFIPKDGFHPMARIINSYDLTRALSVASYGLRLVCSNGMVAPVFTKRYRRHHSFSNISLKDVANAVKIAMNAWIESKDIIRRANNVRVDSEEAIKSLQYPKKYTERMVKEVETPEDTVYNIWNGITWVISHQVQDNVQTDRLIEFQQTANKIFDLVKP